MSLQKPTFPVGYHRLHRSPFFNFTLNRWHSIGQARLEDMRDAGRAIRRYEDWKPEMVRIADRAAADGRLLNASIYCRSAEFYTLPQDPDRPLLYDRFRELFDEAFRGEIARLRVPYEGAYLPAVRVAHEGERRGAVLLHGGYDSFLEEWYLLMRYLAGAGYEVIAFEGPGQGEALLKAGLPLDHRWERPTAAVLDHLGLDDVTLFGLSMGGWFCLRAAAFEPRVKRVVASGGALDYLEIVPAAIRWMFTFFMRYPRFFNQSSYWKMEKNPRMKWEISQAMHITAARTPLEAAQKTALSLSRENMHADRIRQDVLLLSGRDDHFIPIRLHPRQVEALVNARSVTDRVFTRDEHAQNHCQVGNIGLLLDAVLEWLETVS